MQNARSCSIEILREDRNGWGAVLGRSLVRSSFSLVDRFGKKGLDSFRFSFPVDVDGRGGGFSAPAPASAIRAPHDLALLRIPRRTPSLVSGGSAGVSGWSLAVVGGLSKCLEVVGVLLGFENGSRGSGFSGMVDDLFSKSLCLTDLLRVIALLFCLTNDRWDG